MDVRTARGQGVEFAGLRLSSGLLAADSFAASRSIDVLRRGLSPGSSTTSRTSAITHPSSSVTPRSAFSSALRMSTTSMAATPSSKTMKESIDVGQGRYSRCCPIRQTTATGDSQSSRIDRGNAGLQRHDEPYLEGF